MNKNKFQELVVFASKNETIDKVYKKISFNSKLVKYPGIAIIIGKNKKIEGVITDGDFRRAYVKKINFNFKIDFLMIKNPILIYQKENPENIPNIVIQKISKLKRLRNGIKHIIYVNEKKQFIDIKYYDEILDNITPKKIAVIGLGYVGLTLATHISNSGYQVSGVDINTKKIQLYNNNKIDIFEPSLLEMIKVNKKTKNLCFENKITKPNDVYIIAVGTPIKNNSTNKKFIINAVKMICKFLKKNDQIILRSTVEIGTTRNIVIPLINKITKLQPKLDYNITFAPERTVEGAALKELKTIPQIIGGFSDSCTKRSLNLWNKLANSTIVVESLESAELIKLANNTFRDVSFAFANELGLICSNYNIDAHELIKSANSGYNRNPIPKPSPGVGGYCLSKDPLIYSKTAKNNSLENNLGLMSRNINMKVVNYIINIIKAYSKHINKNLSLINILIVGVAFKGLPETNDTRSSTAIDIKEKLKNKTNKLYAWDSVINKNEIIKLDFDKYSSFKNITKTSDIILFLNNHPKNINITFTHNNKHSKKLIFDGWSQFDKNEIKKIQGLSYANIGYKNFV